MNSRAPGKTTWSGRFRVRPCSTLAIFKTQSGDPPDERYKSICTGKEPGADHDRPVIFGLFSPTASMAPDPGRKLLQPPWEDGRWTRTTSALGRDADTSHLCPGLYRRGSVPYGSKTVARSSTTSRHSCPRGPSSRAQDPGHPAFRSRTS